MARTDSKQLSFLLTVAGVAVVVAALRSAREVLIPVALSAVLAFLLTPLAGALERWRLGRVPAVLITAACLLAPVVAVGVAAGLEAAQVIETAPQYRQKIIDKLEALRGAGATIERATETISGLGEALQGPAASEPPDPRRDPVPVVIVERPNPLRIFRENIGAVAPPIAMVGIVIVFVVFMLVQREDIRDRLIRLVSRRQISLTTRAMDDLGQRVSRYLRALVLVNAGYGIASAALLFAAGVPSALFFGVLGFFLRFIPYAGPVVGAGLPVLVALATSDTWTTPLVVLGVYLVIELALNNFIEPWFYGASTGVTTIGLLVAAVFWTWVWGVPGLLLSTPLTVCLVVAGRYAPQLEFLNVLLGERPALTPAQRLYQRLLVDDFEEAGKVVDGYLESKPLHELFDCVMLPALLFAESDWREGALETEKFQSIQRGLRELAEAAAGAPAAAGAAQAQLAVTQGDRPLVRALIVPARDDSDALAGALLQTLLSRAGVAARSLSLEDLGSDLGAIVEGLKPTVIVVSSFPPYAAVEAGTRARMVRRKTPETPIIAGLWGTEGEARRSAQRMSEAGARETIASLSDAVRALAPGALPPAAPPATSAAAGA